MKLDERCTERHRSLKDAVHSDKHKPTFNSKELTYLKTMIGNVIPEDEIKGMMMNHHPVVVGVRTGKARLFKSKERPRLYLDEHVLTNHLPNLFCFVTEKSTLCN